MSILDRLTLTAVENLQEDDLVDLEGDPVADAATDDADYDGHRIGFEFEYQRVTGVEVETPDCTVVTFEGFAVGFPPDHLLKVYAPEAD